MDTQTREFDWPVCYEAEELLSKHIEDFLRQNTFACALAARMREETGTLIIDWIDHLKLPAGAEASLRQAGFIDDPLAETSKGSLALCHPRAMLPRIVILPDAPENHITLALRAESLVDFTAAHGIIAEPEGAPHSRFRRVTVSVENGVRCEVVERRGYRGFEPSPAFVGETPALIKARELWRTRPRDLDNAEDGFQAAHALLDRLVDMVGRDLACHVVFEAERIYWQGRNRAAQLQKQRQDELGLGWANQDHHTFRSSRERFCDLMRVMDKLGFERRERFFAGAQAGWGAQILEQPVEGIVVFADLDLQPEETAIDFSRQPLPPANRLGTVGLWVALHGESFLVAGMHHLEARFDFAQVREQLKALQINGMPPFSDFNFLKQAFTEGERWPVRPDRVTRLLASGLITRSQSERFLAEGAIGSHLETLQRRGGFKGFNQKSVSAVITATDPRANLAHSH